MNKPNRTLSAADVASYLSASNKTQRIAILKSMIESRVSIPVDIIQNLVTFDLPIEEWHDVLSLADSKDADLFESCMSQLIEHSHQDVAVIALQRWISASPHHLAEKLCSLVSSTSLPQRVLYRLVEASRFLGGAAMIAELLKNPELKSLSSASHALFLHRAVWHNVTHPIFDEIAKKSLAEIDVQNDRQNEKTLPAALTYLARFDAKHLEEFAAEIATNSIWRSLVQAIISDIEDEAEVSQRMSTSLKSSKLRADPTYLLSISLPVWSRHHLKPAHIVALSQAFRDQDDRLWQCLAGVKLETLLDSLDLIEEPKHYAALAQLVEAIGSQADRNKLKTSILARADATELTPHLSPRIHSLLNKQSKPSTKPQLSAMSAYRELSHGSTSKLPNHRDDDEFYSALCSAWINPREEDLDRLSSMAKKRKGLHTINYIRCLARFKNSDRAVLKLLDFIRSDEEQELRSVIQALHGISSTRAALELISALTRPNTSTQLKLEITQCIASLDLSGLQSELRSALNDLPVQVDTGSALFEIRENISSLIQHSPDAIADKANHDLSEKIADQNLDQWLKQRIAPYDLLSSESKRALRTARFFQLSVQKSGARSVIDLSPAIDMQYKALELSFREMFEQSTNDLIDQGTLQRRLDVIGYARPIEQSMNQFESYIGSLPVISAIPFFSKFKLRKMLRAICQYRPGRRFTLDGIKAFALFFLVFGRQDCRYGLSTLIHLPFKQDKELFEFSRLLHIFQDTRNRAAHEGFQPDAAKDIDAVWGWTADILKTAAEIATHMQSPQDLQKPISIANEVRQEPEIIYKKVSA